jgi:hypothetical protein
LRSVASATRTRFAAASDPMRSPGHLEHALRRLEREAAAEHRRRREALSRHLVELREGVDDHPAHRRVLAGVVAPHEQIQRRRQAALELRQGEDGDARRGELDRERDAVRRADHVGERLEVASAATPAGDVFAGLVATSGNVYALRFSPATGWAAPIAIDAGASPEQRPAAATGICGDDALFAYSARASNGDGEVRVARVRGNATETTAVAKLVNEDVPNQMSLATRRDSNSL